MRPRDGPLSGKPPFPPTLTPRSPIEAQPPQGPRLQGHSLSQGQTPLGVGTAGAQAPSQRPQRARPGAVMRL